MSIEYGGDWWVKGEYEDVNLEMIRIAGVYIPDLMAQARHDQKSMDINEARGLLAKYNMKIEGFPER